MEIEKENLTEEQQAKLDALMAELETLPLYDLILQSARLRCPQVFDDRMKAQMRLAMRGGIAAEKLLAYLVWLRTVNEWRSSMGDDLRQLKQEGDRLLALGSLDAAKVIVMSDHLLGQRELTLHFFAVCVGRIERFLPIVARAAGYRIPQADLNLLAAYRPLRDYYEHLENRLPGGSAAAEAVTEEEDDERWQVRMALPVDDQGRFVINGVAADVTPRGMVNVEEVIQRHWDQIEASALGLVRRHFEANPTNIPSLGEVN